MTTEQPVLDADAAAADTTRQDVAAACYGDERAFARLIDRFRPVLNRRMRRFARGPADLDELVQDVFVEAYFSLPKFRGDSPFEHWLQRIATRVGYRRWKRQRRERGSPLPADVVDRLSGRSIGELTAGEADEALSVVLSQLPPRDRLVVTLMHVEGRDVSETATLTGRLTRRLDLDPGQAIRVQSIVTDRLDHMQAIRHQFQPGIDAELRGLHDDIGKLLRSDQKQKWDSLFDVLTKDWLSTEISQPGPTSRP